ncbi:MAG: hypothetical protein COA85_07295 [Robiginitomaculum sp.]|nr:MAG: hypothetical protein COA85_07295 [Robiginitomaculum sp.]
MYTKTHLRLGTAVICALPVLFTFAGAATAQENLREDEIIITALKKPQNLQDVASSVSVVSGDNLQELNIYDPADLSDKVPGVVVTNVQGYRRSVTIRGVGNEIPDNAGTKPAVAFHVDGIFMANDYALFADLVDIQRVEIIRGPDGTVFGNSSTGGAINVVTKKPDFDGVSGYLEGTAGSFSTADIRGAVNMPLSDKVALRLSAAHREHDGFTKNLAIPGRRLDDENDDTLKAQVLFQPTTAFSALFQWQYYKSDINGPSLKGGFDTASSDPRVVAHDTLESFRLENNIGSAIFHLNTDVANVSALFSYQNYDMSRVLDFDRSSLTANDPAPLPLVGVLDLLGEAPIPQFVGTLSQVDDSYTAELNITSPEGDNRLDWVAGAFYLHTKIFSNTRNFFDAGRDGNPVSRLVQGPNVFASNPDIDFLNSDYRRFTSYSFFGQATFNITDKFGITGGLRFTQNEFNDERCSFSCVVDRSRITSRPADKNNNLTGKISLNYAPSANNLLYTSFATGAKPNGSNSSSDPTFFPEVFKQEKVRAYEVGSKNRFAEGKVRLNAAAFYYDFKNYLFQSSGVGRFNAGASNLPKAEMYGLEVEGNVQLDENWSLDGNLSVSDTNITKGRLAIDRAAAENASVGLIISGAPSADIAAARLATAVDLTGNQLAKTPHLVANLHLTHQQRITDWGMLRTTIGYTHRGSFWSRVFNSPSRDKVPSYDIVNLNVRVQPDQSRWTAELGIQNLFDSNAINTRYTDDFALGFTSNQYLPPRMITLRARYGF